jgi:hypothetical protein
MTSQDTHDCPGGCGADVPRRLLACRDCWWLLPTDLRRAVQRGGTGRLHAVADALRWYRENRETRR